MTESRLIWMNHVSYIWFVSLAAMIAKAMVIAVKYAFKSDVLLVKGQVDDSLYSPAYKDTQQGEFVW